jgi:hypothetical protein
MSFNVHLYDKLWEEHRQALQHEMAQRRMLAGLPYRKSIGQRVAGRLGIALIAVGSRLEQFEHRGEPVMHSASR